MSNKIQTFINHLINIVKYPLKKILWFHEQLKQVDEFKIKEVEENPLNLYGMFVSWIIGVIGYGLLITFVHFMIFGFQGIIRSIILVIGYGILRWLFLDILTGSKEAIKNG